MWFCYLEIPEFQLLVGCDIIEQFSKETSNSHNLLKDIFYKLMTSEKEIINQCVSSHKKKLQSLCKWSLELSVFKLLMHYCIINKLLNLSKPIMYLKLTTV